MSNHEDAHTAQYMSVQEVARTLGVSTMTIYRMLERGDIAYLKVGSSKKVSREEFRRFQQANTRNGAGLIEE